MLHPVLHRFERIGQLGRLGAAGLRHVGTTAAALAAKRGDMKKSDLKGASRSMEKSMTEKELDEMASTKRKGKPEHKSKD